MESVNVAAITHYRRSPMSTIVSPRTKLKIQQAKEHSATFLAPAVLTAVVIVASFFDAIPRNMLGGLAVITGLGMLLGPLGERLPVISKIGGGALVCLMVPSVLVYFSVFNDNTLEAVTSLMKEANFLYFVICTLVVGSILGMQRTAMLRSLVRVFPPLLAGTVVALAVGVGVAMAFGYSFSRALFYIVVPIIGGGIGEGIIPLSASYSSALGGTPDSFVAQLIPAAVIGNIVAIISAGLLRRLGDRRPQLDGGGQLVKARHGATLLDEMEAVSSSRPVSRNPNLALGVMIICTLFVLGTLAAPVLRLPAPVLVIVFSVILKVLNIFPSSVEDGARAVYTAISQHFIYPLMIGLGMLYIPLSSVMGVISIGYVATCAAVVLAMAASGFFVGRALGMYPVDASLVTLCHSGLGGTGDVAILSASQRMVLMPFAQISTRIGGVTTVILAASLVHLIA
jgi:malate:Na+ symporter